jgi:leucyl aminopeptidase
MPKKPAPKQVSLLSALELPSVVLDKTSLPVIPISFVSPTELKSLSNQHKKQIAQFAYSALDKTCCALFDTSGQVEKILCGLNGQISFYHLAHAHDFISRHFQGLCKSHVFQIDPHKSLSAEDLQNQLVGWILASRSVTDYKTQKKSLPHILWPKNFSKTEKHKTIETARALSMARSLINAPANQCGPEELRLFCENWAQDKKVKISVLTDQELIRNNFPLIYAVGDSSDRRPSLVEISFGKKGDPKICLIGKGVVFDTGGLDMKPSSAMALMKKDMGGCANIIALMHLLWLHQLPLQVQILLPIVENAVSGRAFRPMDILTARDGTTIEIHSTDAEGRLILADCLTYAQEQKPELIIDFATLTGSARAGLGFELPALFSNNSALARTLQDMSIECEDPLWHLPLWSNYQSELMSPNADLNNTGTSPAGAITASLFLHHFIKSSCNWVHVDMYAWSQSDKAGRPRGGLDMGARALFQYLRKNYGLPKK